MRIGFDAEVLTEPKTAAAHYLSKLIEHLIRLNPRLEIVLFSSDKICVDYEPYTHFPQIRRIPSGLSKRQRGRMWPSKVLPGLLREERIDLFHAPVVHDLPVFRPPCPSVVTIFDLAPWGMGGQGFWGSLRYRSRHLAWSRIARRTISLTETVRQDVIRKFRVDPGAVVATPLGCDEAAPQTEVSTADEERILRKYRLDGKAYIVSISGLDRSRRNPLFLLEAFAECHRYLPDDLYFVFTGNSFLNPGEYERALHRMEMLGIRDRVVMTGFVSDRVFQVLVANAAVSVVTPFYSGTPMAVLDAFSYGVPLVASDRGAIPEVAGEAAVLVDPYDSKAIAHAVRGLIERPIEHETYAEKGLNRAKEFSWERMAAATLRLYEEVLG